MNLKKYHFFFHLSLFFCTFVSVLSKQNMAEYEIRISGSAIQARSLGKRIGRVAFECVDLVRDLLRR